MSSRNTSPRNNPNGAASSRRIVVSAALAAAALATPGQAQTAVQGPSSSRTPYLQPIAPNGILRTVTSIVTTTDLVPLTGQPASSYEIAGLLDGLGAYDNGDGTVTVLANHELNTTQGVTRRHGARGAFVAEIVVDKNTLAVVSAQDLIQSVIDADGTVRNAANGNALAFGRFCSADLPAVTAYFNPATGLGTQDRIFMNGEEGTATGYAVATVATGPEKGLAYILPAFNLATNGSGVTAVGAWENVLANPFPQDLTVVASTNDGGTGVQDNTINVYVGAKQASGTVVEKAGLKNGTNYIVSVVGNPVEIVDSTTRATNITNGTRFTLEPTSGTMFSRPEDGAWDPTSPRDFYFVTTDRLDTATNTGLNQTTGSSGPVNQIGRSRLFRLRFDDITAPLLGGRVDILIDGSKSGQKVNMLDNMCVADNGLIYLTEDPGSTTYSAKTWVYDPSTDTLVQLAKMDEARWGDLAVNGGTPGAVSPYTNNKEISGVVDVTTMFPHAADETVLLIDVQDHSTNPAVATASSVEGGQLLLMKVAVGGRTAAYGAGCGLTVDAALGSRPVLGSTLFAIVGGIPTGEVALMMVGSSNTSYSGGALPAPLDPIGLTGCTLYQDFVYEITGSLVTTGPSTGRYSLAIPSVFSLTGLSVYLQAWGTSAGANPAGLITSNGLAVTLGF